MTSECALSLSTKGDALQFLDILLFAVVAAFLIFRLRAVLGRRDGFQGRSDDPFSSRSGSDRNEDKAPAKADSAPLQIESPETPVTRAPRATGPQPPGIDQIKEVDPRFDLDEFLSGARIAFELILRAFSTGDLESLKKLLSPEVFSNFSQSIKEREQAGEQVETTLVGIQSTEVVEAYMAGRTAHVSVKFSSQQISMVRNQAGEVIDGSPTAVSDVVDYWTFARDTRAVDPNWMLVATGAPE